MKWRVVMLRKLAIFIISAGLTMTPLAVQALGFGGIKLKSSLNEKLNAEVGLLSASADDIQSLKISLASEEAFLRSGIDRSAILNKLKFEVKQRSNNDYYIHVTTNEVVREPFMNFLLELNWKNGRMLREYTMLIDPPGRAPKQMAAPAPVIAETVTPEPAQEEAVTAEEPAPFTDSAPMAEPVMEQPDTVAAGGAMESTEETESAVAVAEPEPVLETFEPLPVVEPEMPAAEESPVAVMPDESTSPAATEEITTDSQPFSDETDWPRIPLAAYGADAESENTEVMAKIETPDAVASGGEMGDLDYGITQKNDNLWSIAEKLRQGDESVSVYQVMMALLQSNPDAFIDNNVHRLKVGHVLRISDPSALTSMSRKEAAQSFIAQTESWNNYRQQVARTTSVQPIMAGESESDEESVSTEKSGELTLASPDGESLTAGGGANKEALSNDLATMQDQLRQAKADAGTMRTRNVALNEKLQSLEDELNRLQRSLTVKDDELAALQTQLAALNQKPAVVTKAEPAPVIEEQAPQPANTEESVKEEVKPAAPVAEEETAAESKPAAEPAKTEKSPVDIAAEIAAKESAPAEEGILDIVMGVLASIGTTAAGLAAGLDLGSDTLLFVAAPIVLVLLIIVIIVIRRRRQGDNFQESILTGAASAAIDAHGANSGDSTTFSEESSFLSDFAMSGASAIQADDSEVDPLTEADVFMAYGRYEAAEERLNEAVNHEPDRMELRAKLLELHHATKNKAAFEAAAEDFYARLNGNEAGNPLWEKVIGMGSEIAPGNPLFSQAGGGSNTSSMNSSMFDDPGMGMTDSQVMDIGLETGVFEAADLSGAAPDMDMDFNLDLGESLPSTSNAPPADDFDFNFDMGTSDSAAEPETSGLGFNLDIGGDSAAEEPAAEEPAGLDFNLDFGSDSDSAEPADAGLDFNIGGMEDEISFDMDSGSDSGMMDLNLDASDTADSDIGGGDEVGTKLDLAKAYIDMGDPEGARSILDEVLDEGSATQKEEAQSLLGQIA